MIIKFPIPDTFFSFVTGFMAEQIEKEEKKKKKKKKLPCVKTISKQIHKT